MRIGLRAGQGLYEPWEWNREDHPRHGMSISVLRVKE